jgi:hypothetical protein
VGSQLSHGRPLVEAQQEYLADRRPYTVQDHLKSIFDKTRVRSRREVMVRILRDHYLPGMQQARSIGPNGHFI